MAPVIGYWKMRGLAQPIRLLLTYTGTEFQDKFYNLGPAPDYLEKSDWYPEKFSLGLDFPNLPYYIDGEVRLTMSRAILRYLGRRHGLCGAGDKDTLQLDVVENQLTDLITAWGQLVYVDFATEKENYLKALPAKFKMVSDYLGDKPWLIGDKISYVDFMAYELLDTHLHLDKTCLDQFQNLQDYHKRFQELPAIKTYMASPQFIRWPLTDEIGKFGNDVC